MSLETFKTGIVSCLGYSLGTLSLDLGVILVFLVSDVTCDVSQQDVDFVVTQEQRRNRFNHSLDGWLVTRRLQVSTNTLSSIMYGSLGRYIVLSFSSFHACCSMLVPIVCVHMF